MDKVPPVSLGFVFVLSVVLVVIVIEYCFILSSCVYMHFQYRWKVFIQLHYNQVRGVVYSKEWVNNYP